MNHLEFICERLNGPKADVLLINPPLNLDCGIVENPAQLSPPLGLGYLATIAQQAGLKAAILDAEGMQLNIPQILETVQMFRPDAVGFGVVTPAIESVHQIIQGLVPPYPVLIAGGIQPTAMPRVTIDRLPGLDLIVCAEAEDVWRELCACRFDIPTAVQLPWFRKHVTTDCYHDTLIMRPMHPPDLETLPQLDHSNFGKTILFRDDPAFEYTVLGSRGCAFRCKFCAAAAFRKHRVRYRSLDSLLSEIEACARLGPPRFHLIDDNTFGSRKRVLQFTNGLKSRNLHIEWRTFARADQFDREIAERIREVGCYKLAFGIESGSQATLDRMDKQLRLESVHRAASICREYGIQSKAFFILGYPGDTVEDLQKSIDLAVAANFDAVQFNLARAFPGTRLYDELIQAGYSDEELLNYDNVRAMAPDGGPSELQLTQYCVVNSRSICDPFTKENLALWIGRAYAAVDLAKRRQM